MRYFILLLCVLFASVVYANNPEHWANLDACIDENAYRFHVTLQGDAATVMLIPSHEDAFYSSGGSHTIGLQNESIATVVFVSSGGSFNGETLLLRDLQECTTPQTVNRVPAIDIPALKDAIAEFFGGLR